MSQIINYNEIYTPKNNEIGLKVFLLNIKKKNFYKKNLYFFFILVIELINIALSLTSCVNYLKVIFVFLSLYIFPGMLLIIILKNKPISLIKAFVYGFFLSILLTLIFTTFLFSFRWAFNSLNYSIYSFILVLIFIIIAIHRRIKFIPQKEELFLFIVATSSFIIICFFGFEIPRIFQPDESLYIYLSRIGDLDKLIPLNLKTNYLHNFINGRYLWIYMLISFIGSTGIPVYKSNLFSIFFLIMLSLNSSLFVKKFNRKLLIIILIIFNPLLLALSFYSLNDLAVSFYIVFIIYNFILSIEKKRDMFSIRWKYLFYSILGIIMLLLIKINIFFIFPLYLILVYIIFKFKIYKNNRKSYFLSLIIILPVILFEICVDLPFFISVWILNNNQIASFFRNFLPISPLESFIMLFVPPPWNPEYSTFYNLSKEFVDYIDYFYISIQPEVSSLIVISIVLSIPILLVLNRKKIQNIRVKILGFYIFFALFLYYFLSIGIGIWDISRFNSWIIAIWIPFSIIIIFDFFNNRLKKYTFTLIFINSILILIIYFWLINAKEGVYIGYNLNKRIYTNIYLLTQFLTSIIFLIYIIYAIIVELKRKNVFMGAFKTSLKLKNKKYFSIFIVFFFIFVSLIYLNINFFINSKFLKENENMKTCDFLNDNFNNETIVIANNYYSLRPYLSDDTIKNGLALSPPKKHEDFLKLIDILPNESIFVLSKDPMVTFSEAANKNYRSILYNYLNYDYITSINNNVSELKRIESINPILNITFNKINYSLVYDESIFQNDGINYGANNISGYYDNAFYFNGSSYVLIPSINSTNFRDELTISFIANLTNSAYNKTQQILSKGDGSKSGSFDIALNNNSLSFNIGNVGKISSLSIYRYLNSWHHYVFIYDGSYMALFIDGNLITEKFVHGLIRQCDFNLEIGRNSEMLGNYLIGSIDELQISNNSVNKIDVIEKYKKSYAKRVELYEKTAIFKIFNYNLNKSQLFTINKIESEFNNRNTSLFLSIQINAYSLINNISILLSTQFETELYPIKINIGLNQIKFKFEKDARFTRLIIIQNNIIYYNSLIEFHDFSTFNIIFLITLTTITLIFLALSQSNKMKLINF